MVGECIVCGYRCKYHYVSPHLFLIPEDVNFVGKLYQALNKELTERPTLSVKTEPLPHFAKYYIFELSRVYLAFDLYSIKADVNCYFDFYSDNCVNQLVLMSDDFTRFVEIPSYFYDERHKSSPPNDLPDISSSLLYDYHNVCLFDFPCGDRDIHASIEIGNILERGIGSNLKLNAFLALSFTETSNYNGIIQLLDIIRKALCFLCYTKALSINRVDLVHMENNKKHVIGRLTYNTNSSSSSNGTSFIGHSPFPFFANQLGTFFKEVISDHNLYTRHLPQENEYYMGYSIIRFFNIFSAFESEYNKLPNLIRKKDASHLKEIEKQAIKKLEDVANGGLRDFEQAFIKKAIDRVKQIDTSYSEVQKVINSFNYCLEHLTWSMECWRVAPEDIPHIATRICALRDKVVHNNYDIALDEHQTVLDIAFLERLVYTMQLTRYGMENIKEIIKEMFA